MWCTCSLAESKASSKAEKLNYFANIVPIQKKKKKTKNTGYDQECESKEQPVTTD